MLDISGYESFYIYIRQVNGVNGEIYCDAFFLPSVRLSVRPSVHTQYLDANISKTV